MRKEIKIGLLLYCFFAVLNYIRMVIIIEVPMLHFCLGVLVGLSILELLIGMLPESLYKRLKDYKKVTNQKPL